MPSRILVPSNYDGPRKTNPHIQLPGQPSEDAIDFSKVTRKFYKTDQERRAAMERDRPLWIEFNRSMAESLADMWNKGWRFVIFHFSPTTHSVHATIIPCCGNRRQPNTEVFAFAERAIKQNTRYNNVIWEEY